MEKWIGKTAVITGASSGMGEATSIAFLKNNIKVIGLDVNEPSKELLDDKNFNFHKCDVSSMDSIKETFKLIEEKFKVVNILINCAGINKLVSVLGDNEKNEDILDKTIDVNFRGLVHCTREAVKLMNKSEDFAVIVNICSVLGHSIPYAPVSLSIYPVTKYAVKAFSEIIRQELIANGNDKIRVTNLSPGGVDTNMVRQLPSYESFKKRFPFLQAKDIADGILYVLSTPTNVNVTELMIKPVGEKQ